MIRPRLFTNGTGYALLLSLALAFVFPHCGDKGGDDPIITPPPPPPPTVATFINPLLNSGPDPFVVKEGNTYYYTHTLGNRIGFWKTDKMSRLSTAPYTTVWTAPSSGMNSQNVWAPEMFRLDGKWYIYYTAGDGASLPGNPFATQRLWVLENSSADPTVGSWVDKGKIADAANDQWAIDATVLEHGGQRYLLWSGQETTTNDNQHIYIARMSNPWTLATSRVKLSSPTIAWERHGALPGVNEGPEILKGPTGKTFLIYSASGCWTDEYALGMLTLRDGGDPMVPADWTKTPNPVFVKNPGGNAFGPGHNSFFKSPNGAEDWILYHANPASGQGCGGMRSPRMQKFSWNGDGTPNFGTPVSTGTQLPVPAGE